MKKLTLLTIAAFMAFSMGAQTLTAAPLPTGEQLYSFKPDNGLLLEAANRKKNRKKRKIEAGVWGAPYWGYGPRWGNPCKECAKRCNRNPDSARCRRCRARCK